MGIFKAEPDVLTGITCKTCGEDLVAHNSCRNKACSEQLRKPAREANRLEMAKETPNLTKLVELEEIKNF